jgi:hypothetical protein
MAGTTQLVGAAQPQSKRPVARPPEARLARRRQLRGSGPGLQRGLRFKRYFFSSRHSLLATRKGAGRDSAEALSKGHDSTPSCRPAPARARTYHDAAA